MMRGEKSSDDQEDILGKHTWYSRQERGRDRDEAGRGIQYHTSRACTRQRKRNVESMVTIGTAVQSFHQSEARICKVPPLTEARPADERTRRAGTSFRPPMAPFTVIRGGGQAKRSKGETQPAAIGRPHGPTHKHDNTRVHTVSGGEAGA